MPLPRLARSALFLLTLVLALPASASHFRGGNVNVQVSEQGVATFTYETLWRKGGAFFPFAGVSRVRFYDPGDLNRSFALRSINFNIGDTTVFRDVSDPAFDLRRQVIVVDLPAQGLSQGIYVARWESCCRIAGLQNAPQSSFSLEALAIFDGAANGSPVLNSSILTVVGKGLLYSQNVNAFDPDGSPLSFQFLVGSGRPTYGPRSNIPGIGLDATGQVAISPFDTARLVSVNPRNPAGDYVFKVRVTDAAGAFSERDVLLDVVDTANLAPQLAPLGNRVIRLGESVVLPVVATDPNVVDRITLRTSGLPANTLFVQTPGNPASGTLSFRPSADQIGTFGINLEARDDGSPVLTDSELITITVLDPANGCPVLAPVGNREAAVGEILTFTLTGADPDPDQTLSFSASFLPSGAVFDPASATFNWIPTSSDIGVHQGTVFEVRDNATPPCPDRESVGFAVLPSNRFPLLGTIGERTVTEGSMLLFGVTGSDPDGDALIFAADPIPLGAIFDAASRSFQWQPTLGQAGAYEIDFTATDDGAPSLTDRETVRITVVPSGAESIRFVGVADGQIVAGTLLVEAQVFLPFPADRVAFDIDGILINEDPSAPYSLGGEAGGIPLGFDTLTLVEGLHILSATVFDSAGQRTTAQLKFTVRNISPPQVTTLTGILDEGVVTGTIFVEAEAQDDQLVQQVSFAIDGISVNSEPAAPYFLGGQRLPEGTFDVSCNVCLQVGDVSGDLVVVSLEDPSGTLAGLCVDEDDDSDSDDGDSDDDSDDDGDSDDEDSDDDNDDDDNDDDDNDDDDNDDDDEDSDDDSDDDSDSDDDGTGAGASCIQLLTLANVADPTQVETFADADLTVPLTTFQLPFPVPVGFDTTALSDGSHLLSVTAADNGGLEATVDLLFFVRNLLPPDAVSVTLGSPVGGGSFEAGRILTASAAVTGAVGPLEVRFFANGELVAVDGAAPFETPVLVPEGVASLVIDAVAMEDRGPWQAAPVTVTVLPRPVPPEPIAAIDFTADRALDGRVAVDSSFRLTFTVPVDGGTLGGIRIIAGGLPVALVAGLDPLNPTIVTLTPLGPLAADTLHALIVEGVGSQAGAMAQRFADSFITFPDEAIVAGQVLDTTLAPIPGMGVEIGGVSATTNADGAFELRGVPAGLQELRILGGEAGGLLFPPLDFELDVVAGIDPNGLREPVFLPALDLSGGLDVIGGTASGGGILTSSQLPGMSLDLNGVSVLNPDGTPFSGRMSITLVPAPNVPMQGPPEFSADTFVTVQPARLRLVPSAPITFPNDADALPGEQVPLSTFDHDVSDWVTYGTATVSADGQLFVSNPGQGLPTTGWGCPHPPNTFTTVTGTVVDDDGSPLHGVRVASGSVRDVTGDDGSFMLPNVPAGRQGSPRQIRVQATAKDIKDKTYPKTTPSRAAVQNGTTAFGEVKIDGYAPLVADKIVLHGDYGSKGSHVLKKDSAHKSEERYKKEVEALQKRLAKLGFRQGGSATDSGKELVADGDFGGNSEKAVKLFQTLEMKNGGDGKLKGDGKFGKNSLDELNGLTVAKLWEDVGGKGAVDYKSSSEPADGYGTPDMGAFLAKIATAVNDVSNPSGGDHPDHGSHETGIDVDVPLPRNDGKGPSGSPDWGQTTVTSTSYDQTKAEQILKDAIDSGWTTKRWLKDPTLCAKKHSGVNLCVSKRNHHHHFHFRIDPSKVPDGVNAAAAAPPCILTGIGAAGAGPSDVPVDAVIVATVSDSLDVATLNASTVLVDGPGGAVAGDVFIDGGGRILRFDPVDDLDFAATYTFTITTGAVLADGTLMPQPMVRNFQTEPSPSLRVVETTPAWGATGLPPDTAVSIRFDGPVDPLSLGLGAVDFRELGSAATVPVDFQLLDGQTLLSIRARSPLADFQEYTVGLAPTLRGVDGAPLVSTDLEATFTTALPAGIERIEVAPPAITFTRADLSPVPVVVTAFFADGSTLDLSSPVVGGTDYGQDPTGVIDVGAEDAVVTPVENGEVVLEADPTLPGFGTSIRIQVVDVFPDVFFLGEQFNLGEDGTVTLGFSERIDTAPLAVSNIQVRTVDGIPISGLASTAADGASFEFTPDLPLPLRTDFVVFFDLEITDGLGVTRPFPRQLPFSTAAANLGFELGDLTSFEAEGDVTVVPSFGPVAAPEGSFMAKLITSDVAVGGRLSRLQAVGLVVPTGATRLALTYNFFTDEVEQGQPFNDFFRATLVLPDGSTQTVIQVSRDNLRFSGSPSPVPGFDRMTGFRNASVNVGGVGGLACDLILEVFVSDVGDASIDSAVLIDAIRFE